MVPSGTIPLAMQAPGRGEIQTQLHVLAAFLSKCEIISENATYFHLDTADGVFILLLS